MPGIRNLGFGFFGHHTLEKTVALVKRMEELGFSNAWIAEDYFYQGAFSVASVCAVNTGSITLGIGVINPFTRHPVLSAMEAASLDAISGGRTILGMGASNKKWMETDLGIPYKKPITATREAVQIIKDLIRDGRIDFKGDVFSAGPLEFAFEPARRDLPVYMGVKGDNGLFAAGQVADGVLLSAGSTLEYVTYAKKLITKGAISAGRDPGEIKLAAYLPTCIRKDGREAVDAMRGITGHYMALHGAAPILTEAGLDPEVLKPFREAFLKGETCSDPVTDEMVRKIVVAGTPEECISRIEDYQEAGVEMPVCFELDGMEDPAVTIETLGEYLL